MSSLVLFMVSSFASSFFIFQFALALQWGQTCEFWILMLLLESDNIVNVLGLGLSQYPIIWSPGYNCRGTSWVQLDSREAGKCKTMEKRRRYIVFRLLLATEYASVIHFVVVLCVHATQNLDNNVSLKCSMRKTIWLCSNKWCWKVLLGNLHEK